MRARAHTKLPARTHARTHTQGLAQRSERCALSVGIDLPHLTSRRTTRTRPTRLNSGCTQLSSTLPSGSRLRACCQQGRALHSWLSAIRRWCCLCAQWAGFFAFCRVACNGSTCSRARTSQVERSSRVHLQALIPPSPLVGVRKRTTRLLPFSVPSAHHYLGGLSKLARSASWRARLATFGRGLYFSTPRLPCGAFRPASSSPRKR